MRFASSPNCCEGLSCAGFVGLESLCETTAIVTTAADATTTAISPSNLRRTTQG